MNLPESICRVLSEAADVHDLVAARMIARRRLEEVGHIEPEPDHYQRRDQGASANHQNSLDDLPDFSGNLLFNTLGNLEVDARAGLLFIDFRSGRMLHIIGRARICWVVPETMRSAGVERLIFIDIQCVVNRDRAFPHVFDFVSYSPHLGRRARIPKFPDKKFANA